MPGKSVVKATRELTINFGQVPVAVRLYKATDEKLVRKGHRYHGKDMAPVKNKTTCSGCGEEVAWGDIVNGYELDGQVIPMSKDEVKAMKPTSTSTVSIRSFIDLDEVPFIALGGDVYYVGTGKKTTGAPFALLRDSMKETGKVAVVQWVNGHERLGILMPCDDIMVLRDVLYEEQIRVPEFEVVEGKVTPELLRRGVKKVQEGTEPFAHGEYQEHFSKELDKVLIAKLNGEEVKVESVAAKSEDAELMALMEGD